MPNTEVASHSDQTPGQPNRTQPTQVRKPLHVAVIGCGEVAQQFHLPVLAGHEGVRLVALVDRDIERTKKLAHAYEIEKVLANSESLDAASVDAAIVCTPPFHHALCTIELVKRGIHVLVEKPMATSYQDALTMVEAAESSGVALSVSLFRRFYPSLRMLKAAITAEYLGKPLAFDLEGGSVYGWQAATLGNMRKEMAGGGVLMDMGPHYFDELLQLFDGPGEILSYSDNSLGGIESDCNLQLRLSHQGKSIDGHLELSRTRNLRNSILVTCERGVLEMPLGERFRILVKPNEPELKDPLFGQSRPFELGLAWSDEPESNWYETFRAEIDDWMEGIYARKAPRLSGRSALPSARLIDECYSKVKRIIEPWTEHPMCTARNRKAEVTVSETSPKPLRRVLITGATGFIGCRLAEILSQRDGYEVRALAHNPANAARLARLPVEMVQADIRSREEISRAAENCSAIIHCAIGTTYGQDKQIIEVTVNGAKNVLDAAIAAGVSRFVHISTIAVCGNEVSGVLDESTPVRPEAGDIYGGSKAEAEQAVKSAQQRGLPTVILRPGCVYGPYGTTFITRPIQYMRHRRLVLQESANTPSNTIYVDNLIEAIIRSVEVDAAAGEVFTICDDDGMTWGEFYGFFAQALGYVVLNEDSATGNHASGTKDDSKSGVLNGLRDLLTSTEFKEFGKKVLNTDPFGRLPRTALENFPWLEDWLRRQLGSDKPIIYSREPQAENEMLRITPRHAVVKADKARRLLGYSSLISRQESLQRSLDWLRYCNVI